MVGDATTLIASAGAFMNHLGAPMVAFHPSSFTVQPSCVNVWCASLKTRYGSTGQRALLDRSEVTRLGRFATTYHMRLPHGAVPYTPYLALKQRTFFAHTYQALGCTSLDALQSNHARRVEVVDRFHTATRILR